MDSHNSSGYRAGDCGACPHADTHAETRKTRGLSPHATTPPDDALPGRGPVPTQANSGGLGACPLTGHASSSDAVLIEPIAYIHTPFGSKFGVPRQSGIAEAVEAVIEFTPRYCNSDALRGIEGFSHLWLIWGFHQARRDDGSWTPLVRPPRLGGNEKVGVFACRSPFRPNNLGLSAVALSGVDLQDGACAIKVRGADLVDGTPIYDIKPYIPFADSIPNAIGGFASSGAPEKLKVICPDHILRVFGDDAEALIEVLSCDPRPAFHKDPDRIYGMTFVSREVKFRIDSSSAVHVLSVE